MSKKKSKSVEVVRIATLTDLVQVATPDNYELLMKDLALCVQVFMRAKAAGLSNGQCVMEWKDDGKNEITGFRVDFIEPKE
jgi:hypothetical protein